MKPTPHFVPAATYRLQFNGRFTFAQARELSQYFLNLGIGACYASPIFKARPGSEHGYDVVDHQSLNPELGNDASFRRWAESLKRRKIGLVLDVVPNHMCISESANPWWNDVLENGPSSPYAACFDIDWHPPKIELANKILLPELGDQYGREIENQKIQVGYQEGAFHARYYANRYPISPRSWSLILDMVLERVKSSLLESSPPMLELQSIRTAVNYLPFRTETDPEKVKERYREKEIIGRRLIQLLKDAPAINRTLEAVLEELNGKKGNPKSFDRLELLLNDQVYRLCHWKVAADEINYRRFFDINHLAAIRVEEPRVFDQVHGFLLNLVGQGWVNGLRIDHVDGLLDPVQYLNDLQDKVGQMAGVDARPYVVVEKILMDKERLRDDWNADGTTGYDFLNLVNGLFVDRANKQRFLELYSRFSGLSRNIEDVSASCKKLILHVSMASELQVLSSQLDRISEQHRWSRDFTFEGLRFALREVISYFPAYRSYIRKNQSGMHAEDEKFITTAVQRARRKNPSISESVFDFIQDVLLLKDPEGLSEDEIAERRRFVLHFQQLTSPVMAKGIEDTVFYRFFPLASLNEVGGGPDVFGRSVEEFHAANEERFKKWPHTMLATTTHDTKRSEDTRARISALSEIPTKWYRSLLRWRSYNQHKKIMIAGYPTPDANEEYLFYQTLVGTWPLEPMDLVTHQQYKKRVEHYMIKALKEAKIHTSWINPNKSYEDAVSHFIHDALELSPENQFLKDFTAFQKPIAKAGLLNSLSQLALKLTAPGVPDFYQGTELWNFTLVDPDNRQPVDYKRIQNLFEQLNKDRLKVRNAPQLMETMEDGRIKLFVTQRGLDLRRKEPALFERGNYIPLKIRGPRKNNVCAFARALDGKRAITIATRFHLGLNMEAGYPLPENTWEGTSVYFKSSVPVALKNIFTGEDVEPSEKNPEWEIPLSAALGPMTFAILESEGP